MNLLKGRKGFTLIELLIVITIIGVLAVALVPRIVGAPATARDAARKADLQQIATGIELKKDAEGEYPAAVTGNCTSALDLSGFLTTVPDDPQVGASTPIADSTECADGYTYIPTSDGFVLSAKLERASAGDANDNIYADASVTSTDTTAQFIATPLSETCDSTSGSAACYYYILR